MDGRGEAGDAVRGGRNKMEKNYQEGHQISATTRQKSETKFLQASQRIPSVYHSRENS